MNIGARMLKKERNVVDKHVRVTSVERKNKRKFNEEKEVVKSLHHHKSCSFHPKCQFRKVIQISTQAISKVTKGKGLKGTIHSQILFPATPILVQSYKMPIILAKPRKPLYPRWYDPST